MYRTVENPTPEEAKDSMVWTYGRLAELKQQGLISNGGANITAKGKEEYIKLVTCGYVPIQEAVKETLIQEGCPDNIIPQIMALMLG